MANPQFLDLDDLETPESDIHIKHEGTKHMMRVLDVEGFVAQQKRYAKQQKMTQEAEAVGDSDMVQVIELIRDSIKEFFPTLDVNKLPTPKMFVIFAWLNEVSAKINEIASPDEGDGVTPSAEGKVEPVQS